MQSVQEQESVSGIRAPTTHRFSINRVEGSMVFDTFIDNGETSSQKVFYSFGLLERILAFSDTKTLLHATEVSRRWKEAGRADELWKEATRRLWKGKKGMSQANTLFWRSLFSKDAMSRMSEEQIQSIFEHPLLAAKKKLMTKCKGKSDYQRFLQVHMLDVMSDSSDWQRFFSDIYFGSFACSMLDSKRNTISQTELCTPHGFDMYFKIETSQIDQADLSSNWLYEDDFEMLLYHHSTCYFDDSRRFRVNIQNPMHDHHHTDLKWRWLEVGTQIQVGPYPPVTVVRRSDWGWKLENQHVVLVFRDSHP